MGRLLKTCLLCLICHFSLDLLPLPSYYSTGLTIQITNAYIIGGRFAADVVLKYPLLGSGQ